MLSLPREGVLECDYGLVRLEPSGSISNGLFIINVTIDAGSSVVGNDYCSTMTVSLFSGAGSLSNISIIGFVNIINLAQSTNINILQLAVIGDVDGLTVTNFSSNLIF